MSDRLKRDASTAPSHRTDAEWQRWGEEDPYYGVITDERYRRRNLTPQALTEFFDSGRHHVRRLLKICRRQLHPKFAPRRALDFGCGVGRVLVAMAENFADVVGVDVSEAMLAEARANCAARAIGNVSFVRSDDALSALDGTFDLIHSVIVFQHIEPARGHRLAALLLERLRPGGIAVLHFTYAKMMYAERFGQPPAPEPPSPPRRWRMAAVPPAPPQPPAADPEMQMYTYPLNEVLFSAQRAGSRRCFVEFTDHGGELGVVIYIHRLPTAGTPA